MSRLLLLALLPRPLAGRRHDPLGAPPLEVAAGSHHGSGAPGALLAATWFGQQSAAGPADTEHWEILQSLPTYGVVNAVAFSPTGTLALTGGGDHLAKFWWLSDGKATELVSFPQSQAIAAARFSPDGQRALVGCEDGTATLWRVGGRDLAEWQQLGRPEPHAGSITSVDFSPDGTKALFGGKDGTARIWTLAGDNTEHLPWHELRALQGHAGAVNAVAFSPDGALAATGSRDGSARVWNVSGEDASAWHELANLQRRWPKAIYSVVFSAKGDELLTGSDGEVSVWGPPENAAEHWQLLYSFKTDKGPVYSMALSPDGGALLLAGGDERGSVEVWGASGQPWLSLQGHTDVIFSVAFSQDGRRALTGGRDGQVNLWKVGDTPPKAPRPTFKDGSLPSARPARACLAAIAYLGLALAW